MKDIINDLKSGVDSWWDGWHRFAEETDFPPINIEVFLNELERQGYIFDLMKGTWNK